MFKQRPKPFLVSVRRIWDFAGHNAFTDLVRHKGKFYCTFREADAHDKSRNGVIRILSSLDGGVWESAALIEEEGVDLRDPKLSALPNGRLHLLAGGSVYDSERKLISINTLVASAGEDLNFSPLKKVLDTDSWLWRITWHKGIGYGVAYHRYPDRNCWEVSLYSTSDGVDFSKIVNLNIDGFPNEATIRFSKSNAMYLLLRRSENWNTHALLGRSLFPFTEWEWRDTGISLGGPNFIFSPAEELWIVARLLYAGSWGLFARTALLLYDTDGLHRQLILPSFDDTSYAGLVWHDGFLWISYYSTHEEKTAIYLAKVLIP